MGVCDSLFNEPTPSDRNLMMEKQLKLNLENSQNIAQNQKKGNYFRSAIGNSDNFKNTSMSQSQATLGNNSIYPTQQKKLYKYVNKYEQNGNLQMSLAAGSLQHSNNYSSITSGNKGESKLSDNNNLSTSKSFGEFIIDGKINDKMEGDKDFNNFMNMTKENIGDSGKSTEGNKNANGNTNKKDVNYYHKKILKNTNSNNLNENKERNKEEESSDKIPKEPLDSTY